MGGCKLSPSGLGLSFGVFWGVSLLMLGLTTYLYSYGKPFVDAVSVLYLGYEPSIKGSIIGAILGFINAFLTGYIIAWLYNKFSCCKCACCETPMAEKKKAK
ncbi:bacteriophage holin [uncultured Legionella sp.]|uniref:bacteriophage holin n=1 Tax=uncultured Legionella sp. TaxID=210934 RepID=UPI0026217A38|nr:bacteriophage holin [uncultured Legionella sp.]